MLITNIIEYCQDRIGEKRGLSYRQLKPHLDKAVGTINSRLGLRLPSFYSLEVYELAIRKTKDPKDKHPVKFKNIDPYTDDNKILSKMLEQPKTYQDDGLETLKGVPRYDYLGDQQITMILVPLVSSYYLQMKGFTDGARTEMVSANEGFTICTSQFVTTPKSDTWTEIFSKVNDFNGDYEDGSEQEEFYPYGTFTDSGWI